MKKQRLNSQGLYLGAPEAEVENAQSPIDNVFEDYTGIIEAVNHGRFLVCGRKGAGKSAYAMYLKGIEDVQEQVFTSIIRRDEFDLEELVNKAGIDNNKYRQVLFEWIILVRLVKIIVNSDIGTTHNDVKALKKFYERNAGHCDIDKYTISEILSEQEVNFAPLKSEFGLFRRLFSAKQVKAPFYKMVLPLRNAVTQVLKMQIFEQAKITIIFDDLDWKFKLTNESDRTMIADLLRTVKLYNTDYLLNTTTKVVVLLREDIWQRLEGEDGTLSKTFASAAHFLKWYTPDLSNDGKQSLLRKLINRRILVGMSRLGVDWSGVEDPWSKFVVDSIGGKKSFKYVLDHTFYLPRDIIAIFKDIGSMNMSIPLGEDDIENLISSFSFVKKSEIGDELAALYTKEQVVEIFESLNEIDSAHDPDYNTVISILNKHGFDSNDLTNLLNYNLLVPIDPSTNHMFFSYRERIPLNGITSYTFRTPYILSRYFAKR
ncbi:MAG: hypothetical protein NC418_05125 [Muribaculaceae bacterium]|nr:hypothetical protein [Muribaculaceae bacterium]